MWSMSFLVTVLRGLAIACLADVVTTSSLAQTQSDLPAQESSALVGRHREESIATPVNQLLTPFGVQADLPGMRPQAIALSPDGKLCVVAGKTNELVVLDPESGQIISKVALPDEGRHEPVTETASPNILKPDKLGQVSYTGLIFSHDGRRIYMSNVNGSIKVFSVGDGGKVTASHTLVLPSANAPRRKAEIPSGLALSEDDATLYVCGNLSNRLLEIDVASGDILRTFEVGVAPYDVKLAGGKALVSNWGGRRPDQDSIVGPAGRGTEVRVDELRHIASEGSVSFVELSSGATNEVLTGLHASALAVAPDGQFAVCANAASDHVSILNVETEKVVDTIWMKSKPSDLFGATPNALAFDSTGQKLFVANGTQNAIAVVRFDPQDPGESKMLGMIPVGWFPGAIALDPARGRLFVANIKGLPRAAKKQPGGVEGFNSHHYSGSVSIISIPEQDDALAKLSERVAKNLRRPAIVASALPARPKVAPRAIPERIGEPSLIRHVVYVIKENRTYDQVFGALPQGRGHKDLCIFGAEITPNQHKLVDEFVLLDNTYCAGILSADGHQWSTTAMSTDYMEKSFAGFPRSYPDGMGDDEADALAYSPAGFLWDNALLHKKTIRNYGEFMKPKVRWRDSNKKGLPDYMACYRTWRGEDDAVIFASEPTIETIRPFSPGGYVGWNMSVPDQFRADFIINELKEFEQRGEYPQLTIICLPNDHASGTAPRCPTPASCLADNDLALGRIVEALSHSRFWNEMAIFAIEDDPQAGWDHVSGYRTTAYCISPYAKRHATISTQYNTTSVIRTMEQILGLPPMNQFDASATPMSDCFVDTPNFRPFDATPNLIPLDQMNPNPAAILDRMLREDAIVSAGLNFLEVDKAPEDTLNRILWRAMKGSRAPYPEWAITRTSDEEDDD